MVPADISTCTRRFCHLYIEGLPFIVDTHSYWVGVFGCQMLTRTSTPCASGGIIIRLKFSVTVGCHSRLQNTKNSCNVVAFSEFYFPSTILLQMMWLSDFHRPLSPLWSHQPPIHQAVFVDGLRISFFPTEVHYVLLPSHLLSINLSCENCAYDLPLQDLILALI